MKTDFDPTAIGRYELFLVPMNDADNKSILVRLNTTTGEVEHVTKILPEEQTTETPEATEDKA